VPELNQDDGIHPNAEGQKRVAENVWKVLQPVIGQ
jgi:acyl-CoA thioesterase-1